MKSFKYIILLLFLPSLVFSQKTKLDSVELMMKKNYLMYHIKNISGFANSTGLERNDRLVYILQNCKMVYEIDTIQSEYFEEYDLLLLKNYGNVFECEDVKHNTGGIRDGCDLWLSDFLIGVPKEGSILNLLFFSGNFYCSDLHQFSPLKNDSNLINDTNFIKEIKRLKFELEENHFLLKFLNKGRKGNYIIYERKANEENDDEKIYLDLKKFIFINSEQYQKLTEDERK